MENSKLAAKLLSLADGYHARCGGIDGCAVYLLAAAAEYCSSEYYGFSEFEAYYPLPFEEERLRYLFSKLFSGSARLMLHYIEMHLLGSGGQSENASREAVCRTPTACSRAGCRDSVPAELHHFRYSSTSLLMTVTRGP